MRSVLILLLLSVLPFSVYSWVYESVDFDHHGAPLSMAESPTFSAGFYDDIVQALPERSNATFLNPSYFVHQNASVSLGKNTSDVKVTFLHEGAGFKNSFGYIAYSGDTSPTLDELKQNGVIVFPNTSLAGSGGNLNFGDTVSLGDFPVGTNLMFFVLANTWSSNGRIKNTSWIFSSDMNLNPESGSQNGIPLQKHVAMLWHEKSQALVLGFEDVKRTEGWCDHDFNDVVFTVSSTPPDAIQSNVFHPVPETPNIASNETYSNGIIAFEDLWPAKGDFDFNDVVVGYGITLTKTAEGVTQLKYEATPQAMGATYSNSFNVKLNVPINNIKSLTKEYNGEIFQLILNQEMISPGKAVADGGGTIIEIIDNVKGAIPPPANYSMSNTIENSPIVYGKKVIVTIEFVAAVDENGLGVAPFDSFISRVNGTGSVIEVHQIDTPPTGLADTTILGTADDDSSIALNRYYRTKNNQPWVLVIPEEWENPLERVEIGLPYLDIYSWVTSSGQLFNTWYKSNIQRKHVFKRR